jgi:phage tail-like protein
MANDPLEECSFQVIWGGNRIGMLRVSPVKLTIGVAIHRDSSSPLLTTQKVPGLTTYEPIIFEREIIAGDMDFSLWAQQVVNEGGGGSGYQRNVTIDLLDTLHNPAVTIKLVNCWPSSYEAVAGLNAEATGVAIERLTLEYESFSFINN